MFLSLSLYAVRLSSFYFQVVCGASCTLLIFFSFTVPLTSFTLHCGLPFSSWPYYSTSPLSHCSGQPTYDDATVSAKNQRRQPSRPVPALPAHPKLFDANNCHHPPVQICGVQPLPRCVQLRDSRTPITLAQDHRRGRNAPYLLSHLSLSHCCTCQARSHTLTCSFNTTPMWSLYNSSYLSLACTTHSFIPKGPHPLQLGIVSKSAADLVILQDRIDLTEV
ncbi:hypothetical protein OG21DRAFT_1517284 [Imleria badia]|nr:hypothetical protein OG21DRAFT_1517284 [Imleria badia]